MHGMGAPSPSRDRAIKRVLHEQTACTTVLPSVVRAPVRDSGISREEETAYCASRGVRVPKKTTRVL